MRTGAARALRLGPLGQGHQAAHPGGQTAFIDSVAGLSGRLAKAPEQQEKAAVPNNPVRLQAQSRRSAGLAETAQ